MAGISLQDLLKVKQVNAQQQLMKDLNNGQSQSNTTNRPTTNVTNTNNLNSLLNKLGSNNHSESNTINKANVTPITLTPTTTIPTTTIPTTTIPTTTIPTIPINILNKEPSLLDISADKIETPSTNLYSQPLTELTNLSDYEDTFDYMERIDRMPPLEELLERFSKPVGASDIELNPQQLELITLVKSTLTDLDDSIDLKQIDVAVTAITERLQENPIIIDYLNVEDMNTLVNCFDRLYSVKSTISKDRKAKNAEKKTKTTKQAQYMESINEDDLDI